MLGYLRRNVSLVVGLLFLGILAVFIVVGALTVDTGQCPAAVGAGAPATLLGLSVRHRPQRARLVGGDGGGHAADIAHRLYCRFYRRRRRRGIGVYRRLLPRAGRYGHSQHRRYRPDRAAVVGADHYRRLAEGQPQRKSDGDHHRVPGVAQPDPHHPLPGPDISRTGLCGDRAAQRHERAGDHLSRADAQSAALSRRHTWSPASRRRSWPRSGWKCWDSGRSRRRPSA